MNKLNTVLLTVALVAVVAVTGYIVLQGGSDDGGESDTKVITDMRGVDVEMPVDPSRVVIIDRGFIAQLLVALDVDDKVVAEGGLMSARTPPPTNTRDSLLLNPEYVTMPNVGYPGYLPFNSDKLASVHPDLVIWKQGAVNSGSPEMQVMTDFIENHLKVPLFVIFEPGYDKTPATLDTVYDSITMIGKIFNKEQKAESIVSYTKQKIAEVSNLTSSIPVGERPTIMVLGLANEGAGAYAYGPQYTHGLFIEDVVGVRNLITEYTNQMINLENIITKNPDYIVIVDGPVNPDVDVLLNDPRFEAWKELDAVKNGNVCSIGQLSWWGENMMNSPSIFMIIAKLVHPDLFEDVDTCQWIKNYEMELYGVDSDMADKLMYAEKLYWDNLIPGPL